MAWASGLAPHAAALRATDMKVPTPRAVAVSLPSASFHLRSTAKAGTGCSSWVDLLTQAAMSCHSTCQPKPDTGAGQMDFDLRCAVSSHVPPLLQGAKH